MAEVFVGQIMMTGFPFAPTGFARCDGALLPINQNQALFALLGTTYGGNGTTNFALPDLRGRTPAGGGFSSADPAWQPTPYAQGAPIGLETELLLSSEMPLHTHAFGANTANGTVNTPVGTVFATSVRQGTTAENCYVTGGNLVPLAAQTIGPAGGSTPHPNIQPTLTINFNIATSGYFPSRN